MTLQFKKASKTQAKLRLALMGPAGSGKSFTSLSIGTNLGQRVAVIDTEHGSMSKYADRYEFDVLELDDFDPMKYVEAIRVAEGAGYDVIIVDSLSHEWNGPGGALEQVDDLGQGRGGKFSNGWRNVTPKHNALIDAIVRSRSHIIATMRTKIEYKPDADGTIKRIGAQPVARDGTEYEFDVAAELDQAAMRVFKTRCPALENKKFIRPGKDVADILKAWLSDGTPMPEPGSSPAKPNGNGHTSLEGQLAQSTDLLKDLADLDVEAHDFDEKYKAVADKIRALANDSPIRKAAAPKAREKKLARDAYVESIRAAGEQRAVL